METFTCWHGDLHNRIDEDKVRAYDVAEAAERFALAHDEGDDYDIVFVLEDDEVHEFKCTFEREVTCRPRRMKRHAVPTDDEEV